MREADNTKIKLNEQNAIRSAKFLDNIFRELNIKYWMDYGTLLGIVRNKKFIPYDTDIECYMFFKGEKDKRSVVTLIKLHGFEIDVDYDDRQGVIIHEKDGYVHMSFGWFKYHPILGRLMKLIPKRVILCLGKRYTHSKSRIIRPYEGEIREKRRFSCWVRSSLPLLFVGKTKRVKFYNFEVNIPERAEELLQIRYGPDWIIPKKKYKGYTV